MANGEYSVCQFFQDDTHEYVRRYVDEGEAIRALRHYTDNVATRMGVVKRVIITDGGDCVVVEWIHGEGIVWPPKKDA